MTNAIGTGMSIIVASLISKKVHSAFFEPTNLTSIAGLLISIIIIII